MPYPQFHKLTVIEHLVFSDQLIPHCNFSSDHIFLPVSAILLSGCTTVNLSILLENGLLDSEVLAVANRVGKRSMCVKDFVRNWKQALTSF